MRIAVLADTHIPKRAKTLPDSAWEILESAEVILHAGDVLTNEFLSQLAELAPLYAVRGNNDCDLENLPETLEFELDNVHFAMIHDSGDKKQRAPMRCALMLLLCAESDSSDEPMKVISEVAKAIGVGPI